MKRKVVTTIMVVSLVAMMTACGDKSVSSKKEETTKAETQASKDENYKISDCVQLGEYKGLKKEAAKVTDEDVDTYIKQQLESNAEKKKIKEGKVKDGDTVNIDYEGKKDGKAFEGGSQKGYDLTIGSNTFIDGFEDGLIGAKVGETVKLNLTFPKNYNSKELAGKKVVFTVKVNYIQGDPIIPELNDKYVKKNTNYKTVEEYKKATNEQLLNEKQAQNESAVWQEAVKNTKIKKYPQVELDKAFENIKSYYQQMAASYNTDLDTILSQFGSSEKTFEEDTKDIVKAGVAEKLVALAIAEKEGLEVTDKEYEAKIDEFVNNGYGTKEDIKKKVKEEDLKQQLLMEKAQKVVIDSAVEK
ncbi:trigger factor [Velocimicrobium porci]|nr:trigger factor [Velocimicrobium porci]